MGARMSDDLVRTKIFFREFLQGVRRLNELCEKEHLRSNWELGGQYALSIHSDLIALLGLGDGFLDLGVEFVKVGGEPPGLVGSDLLVQ